MNTYTIKPPKDLVQITEPGEPCGPNCEGCPENHQSASPLQLFPPVVDMAVNAVHRAMTKCPENMDINQDEILQRLKSLTPK